MELYWQGKNISSYVNVVRAVHRDVSQGASDCLELELDHAATWYRWGPQTDETVRLVHGGYDTGILYLNTLLPYGNRFRLMATSVPSAAARKEWGTHSGMTLGELLHAAALACGMKDYVYGIDEDLSYPFLTRRNEGWTAFLDRVCGWEGAVLKCVNGGMRVISIAWAQERKAALRLTVNTDEDGARWIRREGTKYAALTVRTPWLAATAEDKAVSGENRAVVTGCPARNDAAAAGRWARGLLLSHNRQAEALEVESADNLLQLGAMERVDVEGETAANGEWIVDSVEHDLVRERTRARLVRVIRSIE